MINKNVFLSMACAGKRKAERESGHPPVDKSLDGHEVRREDPHGELDHLNQPDELTEAPRTEDSSAV